MTVNLTTLEAEKLERRIEALERGRQMTQPETRFDPVGAIESLPQIISELRIAGQRMQIQAGVMKQWSERFIAFADALSEAGK